MILEIGEKIHVIARRNFESDMRRHFIGEVLGVGETIARIEGYSFIFDHSANLYIRRPEKRIRLIGLGESGNIINILPKTADLLNTKYTQTPESRLVVTDEKTFSLDINEFGVKR